MSAGPADGLALLTYNIKSATLDRRALLRVLRELAPDVLVAQEGPNHVRWRAAAARLAREAGLLYLDGGRPAGTTMLFVRMRVDTVATWSRRWPTRPGEPIRGVVGGLLRFGGQSFGVVGAHYPLQPADRLSYGAQVVAAVEELRGRTPSVFVCADLNEEPDGPAARQLLDLGLVDSVRLAPGGLAGARPTFPTWEPRHRLDTIWCPAGVSVDTAGIPGAPLVSADDLRTASDHLPWLASVNVGVP